jgi:hypothetical protein
MQPSRNRTPEGIPDSHTCRSALHFPSYSEQFVLDSLYFNKPCFDLLRRHKAQVLFKSEQPPFREVLADAKYPTIADARPPKMYHIVCCVRRPLNTVLRLSAGERDATTPMMIRTTPAINRTTPSPGDAHGWIVR